MQLACGMQPEAPPIAEIHDDGITSERSSSEQQYRAAVKIFQEKCTQVRRELRENKTAAAGQKSGSRPLSLIRATKARNVARAMRKELELQTMKDDTNASMCDEVDESDKSLATE